MKQLVYAMRDRDTQLVKIGISVDPAVRAVDVAKQFCADVELLGILEVEDAHKVEQFMHSALASHRVMGEWFQPDPKTLGYVLAFFVKPENVIAAAEAELEPEVPETKSFTKSDRMTGMNDEIRRVVIEEMKKRGITRYQMAKDLEIESPNISRLLNGRSGKVPESWNAIFNYLGLELKVGPKDE